MLLAILHKQGFSSFVGRFFALYLVDRFTSYLWGSFRSGPRQADVGVGQGSALSPVLLALYIAPVMKLYLPDCYHAPVYKLVLRDFDFFEKKKKKNEAVPHAGSGT